jgi:hypothetical protein
MRVQAWFTYQRLGALWDVRPGTVKDWVSALRRTDPDLVHVSYRLIRGFQRVAFIAQMTAEALQARHFPKDRMPTKLRGALNRNRRPPSYIRRRMVAEAAERAAMAPERGISVPARPATGSDAGRTPPVVRRLTLPAMLRRDAPRPRGPLVP